LFNYDNVSITADFVESDDWVDVLSTSRPHYVFARLLENTTSWEGRWSSLMESIYCFSKSSPTDSIWAYKWLSFIFKWSWLF